MNKIVLSLVTIISVAAIAATATAAYFSDTETSTGNTFAAGTLDLDVDNNNGNNTVKFTVSNMKPGDQPIDTWELNNVGSLDGYLDLENIAVTNNENDCLEPELEAGDDTCDDSGEGDGELQGIVSLSQLFWDDDCDGWVGEGETAVYDGKVGAIAANYETDRSLAAGSTQCLTGQFNWWSEATDDRAMGDDFTLDMTLELAQTAGQ